MRYRAVPWPCWLPRARCGRPACRRARCWRIASRADVWRRLLPDWPAPASRHGRGDRDQRQDQHGRVPAPDLDRGRQEGRESGHARPDSRGLRSRPGPDHARSGGAGADAGAARPRRRPARRDGGLVARSRSVPPRRRASGGRGVHQPDARPSRLSRLGGRLSGRQAAAVRGTAADRRAGGGKQRHGCGDACRAGRCRDASGARSSHGRRDRIGDPSAGGRTASRRTAFAHRSRQVSGARSCSRCRVGSRPTTP